MLLITFSLSTLSCYEHTPKNIRHNRVVSTEGKRQKENQQRLKGLWKNRRHWNFCWMFFSRPQERFALQKDSRYRHVRHDTRFLKCRFQETAATWAFGGPTPHVRRFGVVHLIAKTGCCRAQKIILTQMKRPILVLCQCCLKRFYFWKAVKIVSRGQAESSEDGKQSCCQNETYLIFNFLEFKFEKNHLEM